MKRMLTLTFAIVLGTIAGATFSGCAGTRIRQVPATDFVTRAEEIERVSSFNWTTYIGSTRGRAYLEYAHPSVVGKGTRTTVFWTPLSDLPDELAEKLKAGTPPWKPWQSDTTRGTSH